MLIPCLRYENAPAAIDFLCHAFGFKQQMVLADETDPSLIHHAQLQLGDALIMLGTATPGGVADLYGWKTPAQAGGITACVYAVVEDADAHHAAAEAAGAEIVTAPHDNDGYAGRSYSARDPEGNVWDFGTYDPRVS